MLLPGLTDLMLIVLQLDPILTSVLSPYYPNLNRLCFDCQENLLGPSFTFYSWYQTSTLEESRPARLIKSSFSCSHSNQREEERAVTTKLTSSIHFKLSNVHHIYISIGLQGVSYKRGTSVSSSFWRLSKLQIENWYIEGNIYYFKNWKQENSS